MTQYKRVGVDFTCDFATTPDPRFWEPIPETTPPAPAPAAEPETSK